MSNQKTKTANGRRMAAVAAVRQQHGSGKAGEGATQDIKPDAPVIALPEIMANIDSPAETKPDQLLRSVTGTVIDPISLLFDTDWYTTTYPDVAAAGLDPIRHFFDNGAREGRNPNPCFDTTWYLSMNTDVATSRMNPFLHYLLYGAREGRKPQP